MAAEYIQRASQRAEQRVAVPWMLVLCSSTLALLGSIWPVAHWAIWMRPAFVAMVVIYWITAVPFRLGVMYAWCMGLALDLLKGSPLCQNALGLTVVAYLTFLFHQRIALFSLIQQSLTVFALVGIYQLLDYWLYSFAGVVFPSLAFLLPALFSAALWPFVHIVLDRLHI